MVVMFNFTREEISDAIASFQFQLDRRYEEVFSTKDSLRPSAVLLPLINENGLWQILFTRRSDTLVEHRGQVAFPGGAQEIADTDLKATALREMYEEIGVDPQDVCVLGELGDMPVITGYLVRIFVGQIPWPYDLCINQDEVETVFKVPLSWLADPSHHTVKIRNYSGSEIPVVYFDLFEDQQIWGASADMALAFLDALRLLNNPI